MRIGLLPKLTIKVLRRRLEESLIFSSRSLLHTVRKSRRLTFTASRGTTKVIGHFSIIPKSRFFSTSSMMLGQDEVPFVPQNAEEIQALLQSLHNHAGRGKEGHKTFSCKKTTFPVEGSPSNLTVDSWRFQDWDYKRTDLPTYARGLFTAKNEKDQPEIAIRGYDKFFNINEMPNTRWTNIESNTKGPYELSLKENGCIIFISGLHDGSLLVTSKHSTGPRKDAVSHALAGEKWVDRQLNALGKTRQDLARELRKRNVTAVAELCDDDFEEHILAYTEENAGLYLHGMNVNVPEFTTYPGNQVHDFADQWGFRKVEYLMHDTIESARTFLESVAETGSYNGRDVEGFVIRCKARVSETAPYTDWFFKYKFEEPYLMYRQWRECTKAIISKKTPKFRKHVKATENYILYVKRRLAADPNLGKAYQQNHGIIGLRNDFLKEIDMKGADLVREEYSSQTPPGEISKDVVLVPIATIGCGKTTIGMALHRLFNWGIIQNDNITGKGRPARMTALVLEELAKVPVVFSDRNNAAKDERKQIINDVRHLNSDVRLVALHFVHSPQSLDAVRKITQDRVFARGDNHQTIQASSEQKKVVGIMEGFVSRFQPADASRNPDDGFDAIIDLNPLADSRQNLETVIAELHNLYPKIFPSEMPSSEDLDNAIDYVLNNYKPDLKHVVGSRSENPRPTKQNKPQQNNSAPQAQKKKQRPLEYISVTLPINRITSILEAIFRSTPEKAFFFEQLKHTNRIQNEFHVTLMHRASAKTNQPLWDHYSKLHSALASPEDKLGDCKVLLERIVWDDRIMAIVVRLVDENWTCTNEVAHVTVGTRGQDVKPRESNDLLGRWLTQGSGGGTGIGEVGVEGRVVLDGVVRGVLSR